MIFPNLCLGVRSLDFGLEAANTASTALAAARGTREGGRKRRERKREKEEEREREGGGGGERERV